MSAKEIVKELLETQEELCSEIHSCYKKAKDINEKINDISNKFSIIKYKELKLRKKSYILKFHSMKF